MNFTKTLFIILISALGFVPSFSQGLEYKKSFEGLASFYGKEFNGKTTANGDVFNSRYYTCAHRTLPFGTLIQIENPRNGKKVIVKVKVIVIRGIIIQLMRHYKPNITKMTKMLTINNNNIKINH